MYSAIKDGLLSLEFDLIDYFWPCLPGGVPPMLAFSVPDGIVETIPELSRTKCLEKVDEVGFDFSFLVFTVFEVSSSKPRAAIA